MKTFKEVFLEIIGKSNTSTADKKFAALDKTDRYYQRMRTKAAIAAMAAIIGNKAAYSAIVGDSKKGARKKVVESAVGYADALLYELRGGRNDE